MSLTQDMPVAQTMKSGMICIGSIANMAKAGYV
jgi:hypothetical protein